MTVTSSAFADLKVTGMLEGGYASSYNVTKYDEKTSTPTKGIYDTSGFGIRKSMINFVLSEEISTGLSFTGQLSLQGADRSGASDANVPPAGASFGVTGGDSFLSLASDRYGTVTLGSFGGGSYLAATNGSSLAGVAKYDFQGTDPQYFLYGGMPVSDSVSYSLPVGPVTLSVACESYSANPIGVGMTSNTLGQNDNLYNLDYQIGNFAFNAGYRTFDSKQTIQFNTTNSTLSKDEWRSSASYDFGVAKVGGGIDHLSYVDGQPNKNIWLVGVAVPVGPWTLGAEFTKVQSASGDSVNAVKPAAQKVSANQIGLAYTAQYDFSKQTQARLSYARWQQTNYLFNTASEVMLILAHSF